ncbi:hypothetical protein ACFQY8_08000, partial [Alloscardovia venturai]
KAGYCTSVSHSMLGCASFTRDKAGRVVSTRHDGVCDQWVYKNGFVVEHTHRDKNSQTTSSRIERDVWGRVTRIHTPDETVSYSYDDANQLLHSSSSTGASCTWQYSPAGQVTRIEQHDSTTGGGVSTFVYDTAGELVSSTCILPTGVSRVTRYEYDMNGRRTRSHVCVDDKACEDTVFDWDTRGFLTCIEKTQHGHTPTRYDMHVNALGVLTRVNNTRVQWDINTSIPLVTSVDDCPVESLDGVSYLGTGMSSSWRRTRQQSLLNPYDSDTRGVPAYSHDVMLAEAGSVSVDGFTIMGARVYDCSTLGFLSPDPYPYLVPGAVWQSYTYNYAANNPLSLTDPTGFKPVTDISVINAYNTSRSLNIWENTKKFARNSLSWQTVAGLVITGVGAGLMFTGIGGPVGGA